MFNVLVIICAPQHFLFCWWLLCLHLYPLQLLVLMDHSRNWNILCWNVRGLYDPDKWDLIRNKLEESACSLFCFQETKKEETDVAILRKFAPRRFDCHYRKILLCRELKSLPRAVEQALGKDSPLPRARSDDRQRPLCRGPKAGFRQRSPLPRVERSAKVSSRQSPWPSNGSSCRPLCQAPNVSHSAKDGSLPSASLQGSRQILLCGVSYLALGKAFYIWLI